MVKMFNGDESEKCRQCSVAILDVLEDVPVNICMGTLATLLINFAQSSEEPLESFMGQMVRIWMIITEEISKQKAESNENDGSDGQE